MFVIRNQKRNRIWRGEKDGKKEFINNIDNYNNELDIRYKIRRREFVNIGLRESIYVER
jgi:hypothetical protein